MPTAAVSPTNAASGQTALHPRQDRGVGSLKSEDFFKIMISELQQQDPLQPSKTSDMISQVSQIRSIELSGKLTDTLDQLASQQRTAGTSELLGKYVSAQTSNADGQPVVAEGVVTGVRYSSDGAAILDLDNGGQIPASAVTMVTTVEQHDATAAAHATGVAGNTKARGISMLSGSSAPENAGSAKSGGARGRDPHSHKRFSLGELFR